MSLDPGLLFLSLVTSGIGFVLLVYGKKQGRRPQILAGLAFMVYPYFTESASLMIGVGLVLGFGLWLALRQGY